MLSFTGSLKVWVCLEEFAATQLASLESAGTKLAVNRSRGGGFDLTRWVTTATAGM